MFVARDVPVRKKRFRTNRILRWRFPVPHHGDVGGGLTTESMGLLPGKIYQGGVSILP